MSTHPTSNTVFKVFDLSLEISAEETESALNAECGDDRYISAVVPLPGALRIVTRAKAMSATQPDEAKAVALVNANRGLSLNHIVALLSQQGIKRTKDWVSQQRYLDARPCK